MTDTRPAVHGLSQTQREARAALLRRSTGVPCPADVEVDHIECQRCHRVLVGLYVRVRDGLCRRCQREVKGSNR